MTNFFLLVALSLYITATAGQRFSGTERKLLTDSYDRQSHKPEEPGCEGDPHFTGADSSHFDFSGVPNNTYCLISDPHFHVNAFFGGYYGVYESNPSKSLTWMRKIGVLWGRNSVLFEAREGSHAEYEEGYMASIKFNGEKVNLPSPGDRASFAGGHLVISWVAAKEQSGDEIIDVYALDIKGVVSMILELRPEMPHFRTETDGTVHFDVYFPAVYLSDNVHGVLGQTFRSDHRDRISKVKLQYNQHLNKEVVPGENGEGYLDGTVKDYLSSSILSFDCAVNRFTKMEVLDSEAALAMEMGSGGVPSVLSDGASAVKLTSASSAYRRMKRLRLMKRRLLL